MTPRLTLICHAATPALRAAGFPSDETLDDRGLASARAVSSAINRHDHAWTSPMLRCRQTAQALGLTAIPLEALRECDYGRWSGRTLAQVGGSEPEAIALWTSDPEAAPHGGESIVSLIARVAAWLDTADFEGHTVAVTHASVVRAAIVHVVGAPPAAFWRIEAEPLSITDLRPTSRGWRLRVGGP